MLQLAADGQSHTHHVPATVLWYVFGRYHDKTGFFKETFELPPEIFKYGVQCALYGPAMGDSPIPDSPIVFNFNRVGRDYPSRMVELPTREVRKVSIIAGPYKDQPCVLYTVFGGALAPKEPGDPNLTPEERAESVEFWSQHALSTHGA